MQAALRYHEATKHSERSLRRDSHVLDRSNQPQSFKVYCDVESLSLPSDLKILAAATRPVLDLIGMPPTEPGHSGGERIPDLEVLARTL